MDDVGRELASHRDGGQRLQRLDGERDPEHQAGREDQETGAEQHRAGVQPVHQDERGRERDENAEVGDGAGRIAEGGPQTGLADEGGSCGKGHPCSSSITFVAFTVATACMPGLRPISSTASRVTNARMRWGPARISTVAASLSRLISVTTPGKRLRTLAEVTLDRSLPSTRRRATSAAGTRRWPPGVLAVASRPSCSQRRSVSTRTPSIAAAWPMRYVSFVIAGQDSKLSLWFGACESRNRRFPGSRPYRWAMRREEATAAVVGLVFAAGLVAALSFREGGPAVAASRVAPDVALVRCQPDGAVVDAPVVRAGEGGVRFVVQN